MVYFSNAHVIVLFIRHTSIRATISNWLAVSLVVAQTFGGSLYTSNMTMLVLIPQICITMWHVLGFVMFNAFACSLLGITTYQYLLITKPMSYVFLQKKTPIVIYIAASWIISLAIAIHPSVETLTSESTITNYTSYDGIDVPCISRSHATIKYMVILSLTVMCPCILVIIAMQIGIYRVVRIHITNIKRVEDVFRKVQSQLSRGNHDQQARGENEDVSTDAECSTSSSCAQREPDTPTPIELHRRRHLSIIPEANIVTSYSGNNRPYQDIRKNVKAFKVLTLIIGLFLFGLLPLISIVTVLTLCHTCHSPALGYVLMVANIVCLIMAIMNPWLYALRLPDFKREFIKLKATVRCWPFCCCCCCCKCLQKNRCN